MCKGGICESKDNGLSQLGPSNTSQRSYIYKYSVEPALAEKCYISGAHPLLSVLGAWDFSQNIGSVNISWTVKVEL